ncbi:MAG: HNH endonuclease [Candidatus Zapsychrus exili]|nr:HNH endonuclease [Candidatus Zapsychrus exili]
MAHLKVVLLTKPESFGGNPVSNHNHIRKGYAVMTDSIITKTCSKCKVEKSVSEFYKRKSSLDGRRSNCKSCVKEYQEKNKDKIFLIKKQYREAHKDDISDYQKEYRKNHDFSRYKKEYYFSNREKILNQKKVYRQNNDRLTYDKKYYAENREKIIAIKKIYHHENKDIISKKSKQYRKTKSYKNAATRARHKRRALMVNVTIEDFDPISIFERDNYICQLCGRKTRPNYKNPHHCLYPNLDHILPLSKGGEHSKRNTQCLCHKCNMEKNNKTDFGDQLRLFG